MNYYRAFTKKLELPTKPSAAHAETSLARDPEHPSAVDLRRIFESKESADLDKLIEIATRLRAEIQMLEPISRD